MHTTTFSTLMVSKSVICIDLRLASAMMRRKEVSEVGSAAQQLKVLSQRGSVCVICVLRTSVKNVFSFVTSVFGLQSCPPLYPCHCQGLGQSNLYRLQRAYDMFCFHLFSLTRFNKKKGSRLLHLNLIHPQPCRLSLYFFVLLLESLLYLCPYLFRGTTQRRPPLRRAPTTPSHPWAAAIDHPDPRDSSTNHNKSS